MPATRATRHGHCTPREQRFAVEYVRNGGNGTQAAVLAYRPRSANSAGAMASQALRKVRVQDEIRRLAAGGAITPQEIVTHLRALLQSSNPVIQAKGIELWAKFVGAFAPTRREVVVTPPLSERDRQARITRMRELFAEWGSPQW